MICPIADVDECLTENGGCAQTCINSVGNYRCGCFVGYEMNKKGQCEGNGCQYSCDRYNKWNQVTIKDCFYLLMYKD